jgi:hypothetical protein
MPRIIVAFQDVEGKRFIDTTSGYKQKENVFV